MKNIVLIGMPGCGKTSLGKDISRKLQMRFIDMDAYIVQMTGKTVPELFAQGEDTFRDAETDACKRLSQMQDCVIATGGGCVKREENMCFLRKTGTIIFIDRPLTNILSDVRCDTRPLLQKGAEEVRRLYAERIGLYRKYAQITARNNGAFYACANYIVRRIKREDYGNKRGQSEHAWRPRKRRIRRKEL